MVCVVLGLMLFSNSCSTFPISNDTIPSKSHLALPEINIKGNAMVAKRRGDTLVFAADRFKRADAIRLEQLLSNVPGFQVDANGRISFNGKPIQKLMLDGDDLTAENYQLISRNLRSLLIDSIQVLEKYNENRLLKNMHDNNALAINLVLKPSYYGRPTVNLISAYAPKKSGEFQSELIHLRKMMKLFVLVNTNNLGASPLQNQLNELPEQAKQDVLFHSWPLVLQNTFVGNLSNRYINQNGDWGIAFASTTKVNEYTQMRFNLRKSNLYMTNRIEQNQLFSYGDDLTIRIHSVSAATRQYDETSGTMDWERDKGGKSTSKYQLKFYHDVVKVNSSEEREQAAINKTQSNSSLHSNGLSFSMSHTWKSNSNHIWIWETAIDGSTNKYGMLVHRDDFMNDDSLKNKVNQLINHSGANARTSIGYFSKFKKINLKFWLRSSLSTLHSKQHLQVVDVSVPKNYFSTHLTKAISKKFNLEMQSMLGVVNYSINANRNAKVIYHLDHAVIWKRKATQQISFNYGILRQGSEIRKFYGGEVYLNGTTLMSSPTDLSFPLSIYSQLNFSTMDLYRGLTFGGQFMLKRVIGDYFMSVEVDPFYTKMTELLNGSQSTRSLNLHIEKIIHPLRMKYRIQTHAMHAMNLVKFNEEQFYTINQGYRFGNYLSTNWRKGYNLQVEYNYITSKFIGFNVRRVIWNIRHEYKTTFQFQVRQYVTANLSLLHYMGKGMPSLDLLDCNINWMIKNKYRFYIQGFNLFNRKLFVEQAIHSNSISTNMQQLIGRRVILGLDLPL